MKNDRIPRRLHAAAKSLLKLTPHKELDQIFVAVLPPHVRPGDAKPPDFLWLVVNSDKTVGTIANIIEKRIEYKVHFTDGSETELDEVEVYTDETRLSDLNQIWKDDLIVFWPVFLEGQLPGRFISTTMYAEGQFSSSFMARIELDAAANGILETSDTASSNNPLNSAPGAKRRSDKVARAEPGRISWPILNNNTEAESSDESHDAVPARFQERKPFGALQPPPLDAVKGSEDAPWLRLTEWELAMLRKKHKKNQLWAPSNLMIERELRDLGRGIEAYRVAKGNTNDRSESIEESPMVPITNKGMRMNEAKKLKKRRQQRSSPDTEKSPRNRTASVQDAMREGPESHAIVRDTGLFGTIEKRTSKVASAPIPSSSQSSILPPPIFCNESSPPTFSHGSGTSLIATRQTMTSTSSQVLFPCRVGTCEGYGPWTNISDWRKHMEAIHKVISPEKRFKVASSPASAQSNPPAKKLKYIPGGKGGGGRYVNVSVPNKPVSPEISPDHDIFARVEQLRPLQGGALDQTRRNDDGSGQQLTKDHISNIPRQPELAFTPITDKQNSPTSIAGPPRHWPSHD